MSSLALSLHSQPYQPASARRSLPIGLVIVAAHALLFWGWLAMRVVNETRLTPEPLRVSLVQPTPPAPALETVLPQAPRALPAPVPVLLPMPAVPESAPQAVAEPATVSAPAAPSVVRSVAPPAPPPPVAPPPPQTIPPAAVQYLVAPQLVYPRASLRNGERGRVMVRVLVDSQGIPQQVEVAASSGYVRLDEAALAAVRQARFKPYQVDGVAVPGWALVPADFG